LLTETHPGRPKDNLYEPALADSEREAVADLLQYLENVNIEHTRHKPVTAQFLTSNSVPRQTSFLANLSEP
jgi:hypothetical protein